MPARKVVLYALGALAAFGFGFALWSVGDVANACDPTTGVGCTTPTTQPLPGSDAGPPAAQGPSVVPPNQVQPGPVVGGPVTPPLTEMLPNPPPATPPPATVAPVTPSPAPTPSPGSSGGPDVVVVVVLATVAAGAAGLIAAGVAKGRGVEDQPVKFDGLIGNQVIRGGTALSAYGAIPIQASEAPVEETTTTTPKDAGDPPKQ